jgi:hypothetical protein
MRDLGETIEEVAEYTEVPRTKRLAHTYWRAKGISSGDRKAPYVERTRLARISIPSPPVDELVSLAAAERR